MAGERRMRIAIVNDSALAIETLRRAIATVPSYRVAWTAEDGEQAVRLAGEDPADLILMDMYMPRMDGIEATRQIMASAPCPIVVVTRRVEGAVDKVYDAMAFGAIDAVDTPTLGADGELAGVVPLLDKVAQVARLKKRIGTTTPPPVSDRPTPLVVLGASTGGPAALADVLKGMGADIPAAVVLVQHVDVHYAAGLAEWLRGHSKFPVEIATLGARPRVGTALLAGSHDHLVMSAQGQLAYTARPHNTPYRPSVDVFFTSVANHCRHPGGAALLTGMGRDGADGLLQLRRAGWWTIAEDEESCIVYGMPRAAVELGAARTVLPLARIGRAIRDHVLTSVERCAVQSRNVP
jgi:two-component system response regulator WspF